MDKFLIAATVLGGLGVLAQLIQAHWQIRQTQELMNAIESLRAAVVDLQNITALVVQALQRPVVPADEVQALANQVANITDSLRQNLPPIPPS